MAHEPHVVLVGAGHAHLLLARQAERITACGARLTLVDPDVFWYSGLATGVLGGMYEAELDRVDPEPLIQSAGGEFLRDRVVGLETGSRTVQLAEGDPIKYDVLSFNVGSTIDMGRVPGAGRHAWLVKPVDNLWRLRQTLETSLAITAGRPPRAVVIGGGATGCEVAANVAALARRYEASLGITLLSRSRRLAEELPPGASRKLHAFLERRGIEIETDCEVASVRAGGVRTADGREWPADFILAATGLRAPPFLEQMGLPCDPDGGLQVNAALQVEGQPHVFGAGDCISLAAQPLPRLGVFAVREAPVLLHNILAVVEGMTGASLSGQSSETRGGTLAGLRTYKPQRRYLSILNLGDGQALAARGRLYWLGRASMWLKDRIDRRFLEQFAEARFGRLSS
jgi:NADH dehydrogenase FAD-containing subunit